jgi:hypothetical protein
MGRPGRLTRQDPVATILMRGIKIKAIIHRFGTATMVGGSMAVTLPDGTRLGNPNAALSANADQ